MKSYEENNTKNIGRLNPMVSSQQLFIPQLSIPYEILDHGGVSVVPKQVDDGMFRLKTPTSFSLDTGKSMLLKMGIKFSFPKYIDTSPCKKIRIDETTTVFPRAVLHGHIDSIFELMVNHGIVVLGPRVISADIANNQEIVVYVQNIGKKMYNAKAGEEIAELYFTITPVSAFNLIIEQDIDEVIR